MTDWNRWREDQARARRVAEDRRMRAQVGAQATQRAATPAPAPARGFVGWKAAGGILALCGLLVAAGQAPIIGVALLIAGLLVYATGQLIRALR